MVCVAINGAALVLSFSPSPFLCNLQLILDDNLACSPSSYCSVGLPICYILLTSGLCLHLLFLSSCVASMLCYFPWFAIFLPTVRRLFSLPLFFLHAKCLINCLPIFGFPFVLFGLCVLHRVLRLASVRSFSAFLGCLFNSSSKIECKVNISITKKHSLGSCSG